nr:MAG TPA: hypothetical protein [Caudoviricetes sp.]
MQKKQKHINWKDIEIIKNSILKIFICTLHQNILH